MVKEITSEEELRAFIGRDEAVWLFKHSNACGTSSYAIELFKDYLAEHPDEEAAVLVIQEHRDVSNAVADILDVVHKSPQLFLVKNNTVLWHTSHMGINGPAMANARQQV